MPNKNRRYISLGILISAIWSAVYFVVLPISERYSLASTVIERSQRYLASAPSLGDLRTFHKRQEAQLKRADPGKGLLPGRSEGQASAYLQSRLKEIVSLHKGQLKSLQVQRLKEDGSLSRISVRVQAGLDIYQLPKVLHAIESNTPFLFVDALDARKVRSSVAGKTERVPFILEVSMLISGRIASKSPNE